MKKVIMSRKYSDIMDELNERIRTFYYLLNSQQYVAAFGMLDTDVSDHHSVIDFQRQMGIFHETFKKIDVDEVIMTVHLMKKSEVYKGRDYAIGRTHWKVANHPKWCKPRWFAENWVRGDSTWYNRTVIPLIGD